MSYTIPTTLVSPGTRRQKEQIVVTNKEMLPRKSKYPIDRSRRSKSKTRLDPLQNLGALARNETPAASKPATKQTRATTNERPKKTATRTKKNEDVPDSLSSSEEDYQNDDSDSNASDADEFIPATSSKSNKRKTVGDVDDDDDIESSFLGDSDSEDELSSIVANTTKSSRKRQPGRTTTKASAKKKSKRKSSSSARDDLDDFIVDDNEDVEEYDDDDIPSASRKGLRRATRQSRQKSKAKTNDSSEAEQESSDDEEESHHGKKAPPKRSKKRPATRGRKPVARRRRAALKDSDSDEDDLAYEERSDDEPLPKKARPKRSSAATAVRRLQSMKKVLNDDDDDDEEDSDEEQPKRVHKTPVKQILSSDESFAADSASGKSAENEIGYTDSEDDESHMIGLNSPRSKVKAVNIDKEVIGSADESSSSDDEDPTKTFQSSTQNNSRLDDIQPSPACSRRNAATRGDEENCDSSSSSENEETHRRSSPLRLFCPSTEDAITLEALPKIHLCYVSPDGNSRQCFAIETLRQIALKSSQKASRIDIDGSQRETFLQPPHFRTTMNDDLLDQIASRFGRDALNLRGDFYTRRRDDVRQTGNTDMPDFLAVFGNSSVDYGDDFEERVTKYINGMMGSKDLYCCCLCYSEIHRRIVKLDLKRRKNDQDDESDSSDEEAFLELAADSSYDPMTVLGWLDNDKFAAASGFCFGKVADLKKHLRDDHHVQTKDIKGNDLYQRYRIRGTDGLLQRFLHNQWKRSSYTTFQGAMQRYWFDGANQSYVCLLDMIARADAFRSILGDREADDNSRDAAETYFCPAMKFFASFQSRAQTEWDMISSPFRQNAQKDDLRDFLADDDDDQGDGEDAPPFLTHRQLNEQEDDDSDQNHFVHKLERKYAGGNDANGSFDDDRDDDDGEDIEDVSVSSELIQNGYYSEEVEEKDEWVDSIRKKRRSSLEASKPPISQRSMGSPGRKKLIRKKNLTPSSISKSAASSNSASKRRVIELESSSSEEEFR